MSYSLVIHQVKFEMLKNKEKKKRALIESGDPALFRAELH
jgi:hypothetical protein